VLKARSKHHAVIDILWREVVLMISGMLFTLNLADLNVYRNLAEFNDIFILGLINLKDLSTPMS
jgi:hypothetical protein